MGLNTRVTGGSNVTFLNVFSNNIVLENVIKEKLIKKLEFLELDVEDIVERKKTKGKNEGQVVYYYILDDVAGLLTNINIAEKDWGDLVELEFTDVDEKFKLTLGNVDARLAKDFIRRVGNLDLDKEVVFGLWNFTAEESDNGKPRSGVKMYQDDTKVEYFISWDDMPEPEKKQKGRKTVWDFSEQDTFFYNELVSFKEENFKGEGIKEEVKESTVKESRKPKRRAAATQSAPDDLPF